MCRRWPCIAEIFIYRKPEFNFSKSAKGFLLFASIYLIKYQLDPAQVGIVCVSLFIGLPPLSVIRFHSLFLSNGLVPSLDARKSFITGRVTGNSESITASILPSCL